MKHTNDSQTAVVQLTGTQRAVFSILISWITIMVSVLCLGVAVRFFEAETHVMHAVFLAIGGILVLVFRHFAVKWLSEE